jgi:hypothetical protein
MKSGADVTEAMPAVIRHLQTGDLERRWRVASLLPASGKTAAPALPYLTELRDELKQESKTATDWLHYEYLAQDVDAWIQAIKGSIATQ